MTVLLIVLALTIIACDSKIPYVWNNDFKIKKGKIGFSEETMKPAYQLTSDDFWVDRAEVSDLIQELGGGIRKIDAFQVVFTLQDTTKLIDIKKGLKKGWI